MLILCCSLLALFATVQADREVAAVQVSCPDQQYSCECPVGVTQCEFTLRIERRRPFTSYQLLENGTTGRVGVPYILNGTAGFISAIPGVPRSCNFDSSVRLVEAEDFTSRGCSAPITLDGVSMNSVITINGLTPGPTLIVDHNATVRVRVINDLLAGCEGTSIHWHGMYQRETAWMDGVGGITQPAIPAGTTFDYIFKAAPFGTHWYHSHVGLQRSEGMYGALVVRNDSPAELVPEQNAVIVDEPGKFTMTLVDWQMQSAEDTFLLAQTLGFSPDMPALQFLAGQGMTPVARGVRADGSDDGPVPFHAGLINGRGRFEDTVTPLSQFTVRRDESGGGLYFRMRIVGAMNRKAFAFSIDEHKLLVIATDGKDIEPMEVDSISVETGERYDFLVRAKTTAGNYWIRAESLQTNVPSKKMEFSARAILSYEGADALDWTTGYSNVPEEPRMCTKAEPCRVLNCAFRLFGANLNKTCVSLISLVPRPMKPQEDLPSYPLNQDCRDCRYFLNFAFDAEVSVTSHSINATSLILPPMAYQTNCGQYTLDNSPTSTVKTCEKTCRGPQSQGCECIPVIPLANARNFKDGKDKDELESIMMVFSGIAVETSHPIHMHGHAFQVVYIGYGTYHENGTLDEHTTDLECDETPCVNPHWTNRTAPEGLLNRTTGGKVTNAAIQKDTVVIPAGGYVVVAFKADNPGYWYLHCHIEDHTAGGMIVIMQEYSPEQQWLPPPGINNPQGFEWFVKDFDQHVSNSFTCADRPTLGDPPSDCPDGQICLSKPQFSVTMAFLIALAVLCVILFIVLLIGCINKKPFKSRDKGGKFAMLEDKK